MMQSKDPVFHHAPAVIFISAPDHEEWAALDVGMCAENMMLAARSVGLESCPVGVARYIEFSSLKHRLNLPGNYRVYMAVILGYGAEHPEPKKRRWHNIHYLET